MELWKATLIGGGILGLAYAVFKSPTLAGFLPTRAAEDFTPRAAARFGAAGIDTGNLNISAGDAALLNATLTTGRAAQVKPSLVSPAVLAALELWKNGQRSINPDSAARHSFTQKFWTLRGTLSPKEKNELSKFIRSAGYYISRAKPVLA